MITTFYKVKVFIWPAFFLCCLLIACQNDPPTDNAYESSPLIPLHEEYDEAPIKWGFIDKSGEVVIKGSYDEVNNFSDGLAAFRDKASWGYINQKGEIVIDAQHYNAYNFNDGLAKVSNFERKYGIIDRQGEIVIPFNYDDVKGFNDGLCAARVDGKWGYIDMNNNMTIPNKFDAAKDFVNNHAIVKLSGSSFLIDRNGQKISDGFDKISLLNNKMYKVKKDKKYGLIDAQGKIKIPLEYQSISQMDNGTFAVKKGDINYLRTMTKDKIEVPKNNGLQYLSANRWAYEKSGRYGLIDDEGKIIMKPKYTIITPFSNGIASYQKGQLWGYLDIDGKILTQAMFGLTWDFHEGLARCISREGVGFLNPDGNLEFIANNFDVRDFHEGLARIPIR